MKKKKRVNSEMKVTALFLCLKSNKNTPELFLRIFLQPNSLTIGNTLLNNY